MNVSDAFYKRVLTTHGFIAAATNNKPLMNKQQTKVSMKPYHVSIIILQHKNNQQQPRRLMCGWIALLDSAGTIFCNYILSYTSAPIYGINIYLAKN